jgi:transcriptional regulator with XRE-family HTH domain
MKEGKNNTNFSKNLKCFRVLNDLTLENLSTATGITTGRLNFIETGAREPYLSEIISLSKRFGVSIETMIFGVVELKVEIKPTMRSVTPLPQ